jgi:tetratricopeptide (TPR) repeat protein
MAITIDAYTVVAKLKSVQRLLSEGTLPLPNSTVLADDDLWRCSFMIHGDAINFMKSLQELGLNTSRGPDSDVVLVHEFDQSIYPYCEWLLTNTWENAVIAWLAGTEPRTIVAREGWDPKTGSGVSIVNPGDVDGYELLRVEGNIEVYLDKQSGKEVYIGRASAPIESMFKVAAGIILANWRSAGERPVEGENARQVTSAVEMLRKVIEEAPDKWQAHWFLGKGYIALGDLSSAYDSFQRAFELERNEQVISQEFAGVCLEIGKFDQALELAKSAVTIKPNSHDLTGNLALAYLLTGELSAAQKSISAALKIEPKDQVNCLLHQVIDDVVSGRRPIPKTMAEVQVKAKPKKSWQFWKK